MAKWRLQHCNMLKPYLKKCDAWNPKKKKRNTALRYGGFLDNAGVKQNEWEEEKHDVHPTHQHARMHRPVPKKRLNEQVDDDMQSLEELFREKAAPEPDGMTEEVLLDGNRLGAPVAADEAPVEPTVYDSEQRVKDQPNGVPERRELTVVSPDTGPARRPRREIPPVIRLRFEG